MHQRVFDAVAESGYDEDEVARSVGLAEEAGPRGVEATVEASGAAMAAFTSATRQQGAPDEGTGESGT